MSLCSCIHRMVPQHKKLRNTISTSDQQVAGRLYEGHCKNPKHRNNPLLLQCGKKLHSLQFQMKKMKKHIFLMKIMISQRQSGPATHLPMKVNCLKRGSTPRNLYITKIYLKTLLLCTRVHTRSTKNNNGHPC